METFTPITTGPLIEETWLSGGLDYYKPTMSQLQYEKEPDAEVTFTFKNRGEQRLADYVDAADLQQRFDQRRRSGWAAEELDYFASLRDTAGERVFANDFLDYLAGNGLPPVEVTFNEATDDIVITATGEWPLVTYWETIVMSDVNEAYFEGYVRANGLDIYALYDEGDRLLSEKIAILQAHPDITFAEFGTRRHFSLRWQRHVMERLMNECPDNVSGTSNVALAQELDAAPIGTFAHELPMVYAGLAESRNQDIRASHARFLEDWYDRYGVHLSIALTDTFGTDAFFTDFTAEQANKYRGTRHDSGDPIAYGERVIKFYENLGIDPATKTIVFSDGLDIATIQTLHVHFKDRINTTYGWGTTLTNDLGLSALNIVMKATQVNGVDTVKLSDNPGKHTGPPAKVKEYQCEHFRVAQPISA